MQLFLFPSSQKYFMDTCETSWRNFVDCTSPINYPIRANRFYRSRTLFFRLDSFRRTRSAHHAPFLFDFRFCTPLGQIFRVISNISVGRSNMCLQRHRFHGDLLSALRIFKVWKGLGLHTLKGAQISLQKKFMLENAINMRHLFTYSAELIFFWQR